MIYVPKLSHPVYKSHHNFYVPRLSQASILVTRDVAPSLNLILVEEGRVDIYGTNIGAGTLADTD